MPDFVVAGFWCVTGARSKSRANFHAGFFDKTAPSPRAEFRVVDVTTRLRLAQEEALAVAAAAERDLEHTITQGMSRALRNGVLPSERFEALPGHGVQAVCWRSTAAN